MSPGVGPLPTDTPPIEAVPIEAGPTNESRTDTSALDEQPGPSTDLAAPRARYSVGATLRWAWGRLTSMKTALVLLFALAVAAIPGSLLPQRGTSPIRVSQFIEQHPALAPWLDRLGLFDVFASSWFAAVYLLLFVSLAGCVLPRTAVHLRALRSRPPAPPARLDRLPQHERFDTALPPDEAVAAAAGVLRRRRYRVDVHPSGVAAEKGYARESGNLVFHVALLGLLGAIAAGSIFGHRGTVLLTVGSGFANTATAYDLYLPGRLTTPEDLAPFSLTLDDFQADFVREGPQRGQPADFAATVTYRATPDAAPTTAKVQVNEPLTIDGERVYLVGHGYAPQFRVVDGTGAVAFEGAVPFLPQDGMFRSNGVVKVPDAQPQQLAFTGFFTPTTVRTANGLESSFPAPDAPSVTLLAWQGNLGLDLGAPQSVYALDDRRMTRLGTRNLEPGESWTLPGGVGSVTFTGFTQFATFQVTDDPGKIWALGAAGLAITGLLGSLYVRRRRAWVRVSGSPDGTNTVVDVGGLSRTPSPAAQEEFDDVVEHLRGALAGESFDGEPADTPRAPRRRDRVDR